MQVVCNANCISISYREAKLNATAKVIEDIDQSEGLNDYYSTESHPEKKPTSSHNMLSKIREKFLK